TCESRERQPALAMAAPARPPSRACDDEVGSPNHHVMRFHTIAPMRPAPTSGIESTAGSTPLAMLLATATPKTTKAMKLKSAAQTAAVRGDRTRVETSGAIELAAS